MGRFLVTCAVVVACVAAVGSVAGASAPVSGQIAALQRTAKAQQKQINALSAQVSALKSAFAGSGIASVSSEVSTLQGNVNTLNATLTCRVAQLVTIDFTFTDGFAILAGEPEPFAGQVAPDNGACAAAGLQPPTPAADRFGGSPESILEVAQAATNLLGAIRK